MTFTAATYIRTSLTGNTSNGSSGSPTGASDSLIVGGGGLGCGGLVDTVKDPTRGALKRVDAESRLR